MDDESGGDDRDELTNEWRGESRHDWWDWRNESESWFQRRGDAYLNERSVIFKDGWWARKGDNRWGAGTARGLNRDQIVKIVRLTGCKNFVGKRKKFILNAFVDLKPVERFDNESDMWGFRSLNNSTNKRVLDLLEPVKLTIWKVLLERITVVSLEWTMEVAMVLAVLKSRYGRIQWSSRIW